MLRFTMPLSPHEIAESAPPSAEARWVARFTFTPGQTHPAPSQTVFGLALATAPAGAFTLDLRAGRTRLERHAAPLSTRFRQRGWRIDPADARVAVISPALLNAAAREPSEELAYVRLNGDEAFLLFVDRPCRIQAPAGNRRRLIFDARIPHAGVHAIQTRYLEDGKHYALIQPMPRELDLVAPALGLSTAGALEQSSRQR